MNVGSDDDRGAAREVRRASTRRARRPRRFAFACVKFTGAIVVLAVVAAGVLMVRMHAGPIPIEGLGQTIAAGLHDRFGNGLRFSVGGTSLVQHGFDPSLSIDRLKVEGPDGTEILIAPRAEISIDPLALLFGKVKPKRLEVFDVTLRAVLLKNGNLAIAAGDGTHPFFELGHGDDRVTTAAAAPNTAAPPQPPADGVMGTAPAARERAVVMRKAAAALRQFIDVLTDPASPIAAVDRLGISGGTLVIQDQETAEETLYKDLDLAFDKRHGVSSFGLSAQGPVRRWSISAMARGRPGAERRFSLKMKDLTIDELRYATGSRSVGLDMDMPIGMHADIALRPDNTLLEAAGGVDLGRGFLRLDDPDFEPTFMDAIEAGFHWNAAERSLAVDKIGYVEGGGTHFTAAGRIVPPGREGDAWLVDLSLAEPGLFAPARKGEEPIPVEHGDFRGRLDLAAKTFFIDRLSFKPQNSGFAAAGAVDWTNGPRVRLGISMDPSPVAVVKRVWPASIASSVRAWCLNHFEAGLVSDGTLKIDYDKTDLVRMRGDRAPADASVKMDFKVTGGRVRYLDGVPTLDDVSGTGHVTGRTTHLVIDKATTTADGHTATLTGGRFVVLDSDVHPAHATVSAHLDGPVEAVTAILSRSALKPYASLPLDPSTLHGQIDGDLDKSILLGEGADPAQEVLKVDAKVTNFSAERLIGKESLENANLTIKIGDGTLRADGQGRLFGGAATFDITRNGGGPPVAVIALTLDEAARAKIGLDAVPGLTGPMTAHVNTTLGDPQKMKAQVELDLAKTGVAAAFLGLSKPAGRPARIAFTVASANDKMAIDALTVDVGSLQAKGAIDLASDNSFQAARFSSFKVSPGDDMKIDVSKADDTFKLVVRGSTIDARPFLKALTSTPGGETMARNAKAEKKEVEAFKGFDVDLKSNILTGFNKEVMSGAELKLTKRNAQIRQFAAQGRFGRQWFTGSMTAGGRMTIAAQDAGALLSFIDLYKHMEGGRLASTLQMDGDALSGSLEIHDFLLRDEPAIRRLVATSTDVSAPGQNQDEVRRINAGAVDFRRLKVNFQRDGSRLDLHDATMYGPQIGLSVDGWLDYSHDRVGMKGTFVPAFAINNLFSQIPVFGAFLGGKSNEGLLAITFNISGDASSPNLTINPLSVIAPGFLRNIFGVLDAPVAGPPATR